MTKVVALISSGRYRQEQYEDVANLLRGHNTATNDTHKLLLQSLTLDFADLFAADNPPNCNICRAPKEETALCFGAVLGAASKSPGKHDFAGGFDREQFLAACGLDSEN